ncbi:MAG: hypothetical protein K5668_04460 [Lachnospiraceae bacterium]|nr:hypothetical protein [Lachnospiraceae bacterium]
MLETERLFLRRWKESDAEDLGYDINKPYLEQIQTIKDTVFRQIILLLQSQKK